MLDSGRDLMDTLVQAGKFACQHGKEFGASRREFIGGIVERNRQPTTQLRCLLWNGNAIFSKETASLADQGRA